jgi:hypothetical protein
VFQPGESSRQLICKVGSIADRILEQIYALPIEQLESLGEALLDFGPLAKALTEKR